MPGGLRHHVAELHELEVRVLLGHLVTAADRDDTQPLLNICFEMPTFLKMPNGKELTYKRISWPPPPVPAQALGW
jgi:hypothetical protein